MFVDHDRLIKLTFWISLAALSTVRFGLSPKDSVPSLGEAVPT